jgi:hypothetical protein
MFLAGIVLMPATGPGFLVVFVGAAMLAEESVIAARALDSAELKLRALHIRVRRAWRRASIAIRRSSPSVAQRSRRWPD